MEKKVIQKSCSMVAGDCTLLFILGKKLSKFLSIKLVSLDLLSFASMLLYLRQYLCIFGFYFIERSYHLDLRGKDQNQRIMG